MSLEICLWKLLYKSWFSCISCPNFNTLKYSKWLPRIFFTDPYSQNILHLLSFLTPLIPIFWKIWALVKTGCFTITRFSLRSSQGDKFLKLSPWLRFLNIVIFSTAFFIIQWSLQSKFDISKVDIPSLTLFSVFQQLLDPSLYQYFNIYYRQKEKNCYRILPFICISIYIL